MAQTLNNNVFPKGGFVFKDSDNTTHSASSWPGVIARVRRYRERANLPIGDVAAEVIAQACSSNPGLCREQNPHYQEKLKEATLKTRVLQWITAKREKNAKEPLPMVSDEEKKQRAATCASCPRNKSLPGGCSSCAKALQALRKGVIGDRLIDGRLNACEILGEDLPTAIYLDDLRVTNGELPGNCWRKAAM